MKKGPEAAINPGRHAAECKICAHPQREEIEREFINWRSPASIAKHYKLANRSSVYRHAHALGLFPKRQRNVRAALEKIIERAGEVEVNATAVVSAVGAYARINAGGQWVERSERVDLNQLFDRMTATELEEYAREGKQPDWFTNIVEGATSSNGQGGSEATVAKKDPIFRIAAQLKEVSHAEAASVARAFGNTSLSGVCAVQFHVSPISRRGFNAHVWHQQPRANRGGIQSHATSPRDARQQGPVHATRPFGCTRH